MRNTLLVTLVFVFCGVYALAQEFGKAEVAIDYSFVRFNPSIFNSQSRNLNGAGGAFVINFHKGIGLKAEFNGYGSSTASYVIPAPIVTPQGTIPAGTFTASGNLFTYLFGPQFKFQVGKVRPFAEALFGGAHSNVYANLATATGVASAAPANNAFAMAFGGGLDIPVSRIVSIRPVQIDWLMTRFGNSFVTKNQNNFRYQAGIVFGLGVPPAGPPPSAACTVDPAEVFAGEPVRATATARDFNPKHKLSYSLNATGGKLQAQDTTANIDTTGLNPGSYTVTATVNDTRNKKATAQCNATYTVKERPKHPPQISCSANPGTVQSGTAATITCDCKTPDTDPGYGNITVNIANWSASGGRISGSGNTATLDTAGAPAGPITVTAVCTDSRGLTSNGSATVNVEVPPPPPQVSKLNEIAFKRNSARVDNTAKAILDDVVLRLQRDADAKAVIVGYQDAKERGKNLAAQRAANAKEYLVKEKGIDAARIETRIATGATGMKDDIYLVPAGATFSEPNTEVSSVGATKAPYGRHAAPTHKKKNQ